MFFISPYDDALLLGRGLRLAESSISYGIDMAEKKKKKRKYPEGDKRSTFNKFIGTTYSTEWNPTQIL